MNALYENRSADFSCSDFTYGKNHLHCAAHLHYHVELILMLEGQTACFVGTERYMVSGGDAFLVFPNQIHRFESYGRERYYILIVNPDLMPEMIQIFNETRPRSAKIQGAANDPEVLEIFRRMTSPKTPKQPYADLRQKGYLLSLFSALLSKTELLETVPGDSHALKTIISYCVKNYQRDLSLCLLQQELHISKYYISHLFSDKLRISFNDYVNSLRISYACHYLRHSDTPITEISETVGFGTCRTFNRAFLRQMGCTPSVYRKKSPALPICTIPDEKELK